MVYEGADVIARRYDYDGSEFGDGSPEMIFVAKPTSA